MEAFLPREKTECGLPVDYILNGRKKKHVSVGATDEQMSKPCFTEPLSKGVSVGFTVISKRTNKKFNIGHKKLTVIFFFFQGRSLFGLRDLHCLVAEGSGAPNDCFLRNICSEKQILPRIFYCLRKAKNLEMTVPFMYNFRSLSNKFHTIRLNFSHFTPQVIGIKNAMQRGIRKL